MRRRRIGIAAVVVAVALAVAGGALWYKEHTPTAQLAKICNGVLPVDEMLQLTDPDAEVGDSKYKLESWHPDGPAQAGKPEGLPVSCRATPSGVWVTIEAADDAYSPYSIERDDILPLPLGHGWTGLLAQDTVLDGPETTASVLLDCPDWSRSKGTGILVTVTAEGARTPVARVATVAAERTAQRSGCGAHPGEKITHIAGRATGQETAAGAAKGTCAGLSSHPRMRETAAGVAPTEICVLGDDLVLRAYYGPFVPGTSKRSHGPGRYEKPWGEDGFGMWGSARCPGASKTAVYDISTTEHSKRDFTKEPLTSQERNDLRSFATRSADRHGCTAPVLPKPPTDQPGR
ncbi:hypothetical protein AB0436_14805 [Streptomyces sp. NPDC051322]|uniref:hypothetical protein n=1 Tax=Streptomyces sp. NPDC051322 TaxID=3154645 RepID=UPI0034509F68